MNGMKRIFRLLLSAALLMLLCACSPQPAEPAETAAPTFEEEAQAAGRTAERFLRALESGDPAEAEPLLAPGRSLAAAEPETESGLLLRDALSRPLRLELRGELRPEDGEIAVDAALLAPDPDAFAGALADTLQETVNERLAAARRTDEVLNADLSVRGELLPVLGLEALTKLGGEPREAVERGIYTLRLSRTDGEWLVSDDGGLAAALYAADHDALAAEMLEAAAAALHAQPKHYVMPVDMKRGETPDPEGYLITDDPDEVLALLARPEAQRLLEGKKLSWSPEIERFPNSEIRCYLDETILVIVWKEVTAFACGTYAEIVVADGSQLGRRLADDTFVWEKNYLPTEFAEQTQAVLVIGGDFYRYPGRWNGICVYEGEICRFEPDTSDCCFVTDRGELLFVYRGQFRTREEAEAYVAEHHVRFSLCFGPAVIENGENVMPEIYRWGEIYDHYARALLGSMEEGHYLTCAINAQAPGYYHLVTLPDAVDAMLAHGCLRAYALDGGQTATIVLGGELINTVQFGVERSMSDVVFFASALPPEEGT